VAEGKPSTVEVAKAAGMRVLGYPATTPKDWIHGGEVVVAEVNDLLEVGPPARGPGLLMRASSRNPVKDVLDMMMDSCLALHQTADLF
jgi:hypothetical protein